MTASEKRSLAGSGCPHPVRVAIAGGGMGGMALALSLHDAGFRDVDVYESASSVVVRQALFPDEGPPMWNGVTMWRAVTEGAPFLSGRTMVMIGYAARQMVVYPISRRHEAEGTALINWVAAVKNAPKQPMPAQDWEYSVRIEDVLEPFKAFVFDFLDVPALIRGAGTIYQYPMVDRDPLPTWNFGRVTLLGDAAHPMYPNGSNGASQAIIGARVLARELALQPSIEAAIAAYDAQRRPQTARVVLANRQGGPERVIEIVEQRAPDGFVDIDAVISREELDEISRSYKRAAGFDPEVLNNRPSLGVGQHSGHSSQTRGRNRLKSRPSHAHNLAHVGAALDLSEEEMGHVGATE